MKELGMVRAPIAAAAINNNDKEAILWLVSRQWELKGWPAHPLLPFSGAPKARVGSALTRNESIFPMRPRPLYQFQSWFMLVFFIYTQNWLWENI